MVLPRLEGMAFTQWWNTRTEYTQQCIRDYAQSGQAKECEANIRILAKFLGEPDCISFLVEAHIPQVFWPAEYLRRDE